MVNIPNIIFYVLTFLSIYVQVFLIITFLENRKHIVRRTKDIILPAYPSVAIIVPCYNEEKTASKTIHSLLDLNYPQDKLQIILVDDGSTDGTHAVLENFRTYPNVEIYYKENGGKHTAMNLGLSHAKAEFVGGLDADSFAHPEALNRIMTYFNDAKTMAVAPAVVVHQPQNILQHAQKAEYDFGVFMKKVQGLIGGIYVTPGPFSIFRKSVFDELGPYRKAHNTEDQEIALRMQKNHYKIEHCPDAYVYTMSPDTVGKLYRQRVRWIYGFLKNAGDYRELFFNKKYGNIGFFALPAGVISILTVIYLFFSSIYQLIVYITNKIVEINVVGFSPLLRTPSFDWFFVNTATITFVAVLLSGALITSLLIGRKMVEGRARLSMSIVYFYILSMILAPFWLSRAVYNAVISKQNDWAAERALSARN